MSDVLDLIQDLLDRSSWRSSHWKLFIIISLSFLLDGILFSIVPASLYIVAPDSAIYVLAANSAAFMIGAVALGRLADLFGRRVLLIVSLVIYLIGVALYLFLHRSIAWLFISTSLINLGVGGEVGAAYSALAEMIPARHRGKTIMLSANFWNIGAFIIAGLAIFYSALYTDIDTQIRSLAVSALVLIVIVALARIHIPESPRWLVEKKRVSDALNIVYSFTGSKTDLTVAQRRVPREIGLREIFSSREYLFRLLILIIITFTQLLTYNMIAYYAPYARDFIYSVESAPTIIMIANLGASTGAFLMTPVIDRSRRVSTTASYLGGLLTALSLYASYTVHSPFTLFLSIVFLNMIFAEWAWAALSALESELFPTGVRASVIGLNTGVAWALNTVVILLEEYISGAQFILIASILWLLGFIASIAWLLRGVESARVPLERLLPERR
ncbi:MAG: MFS transporter [Sulfolobales archaeon]